MKFSLHFVYLKWKTETKQRAWNDIKRMNTEQRKKNASSASHFFFCLLCDHDRIIDYFIFNNNSSSNTKLAFNLDYALFWQYTSCVNTFPRSHLEEKNTHTRARFKCIWQQQWQRQKNHSVNIFGIIERSIIVRTWSSSKQQLYHALFICIYIKMLVTQHAVDRKKKVRQALNDSF